MLLPLLVCYMGYPQKCVSPSSFAMGQGGKPQGTAEVATAVVATAVVAAASGAPVSAATSAPPLPDLMTDTVAPLVLSVLVSA